jgi:hypothetical protein
MQTVNRAEFFNSVFQNCEGLMELRVPRKAQEFFEIGNTVRIDSFCKQHEKENIYFGVCSRDGQNRNGTRGGKENVVSIPGVWCDIDFKDIPREQAAKRLKEFPFKPSIIVQSGGGVHIYWLFKEPSEKSDYKTVEDVNRRIAAYLGGDDGACDIARVLRAPETFNHKYKPPRPVKVSQHENLYYDVDDFLNILPEVKNGNSLSKNSNGKNPDGWLLEALKGVKEHDPGRDKTGAKIAGYFIDKLPAHDVLAILQTWNLNNKPPLDKKDLVKTVNSISKYDHKADKPKVDISNVYDPARMLEAYRDHIKSITKNRFITGIAPIDSLIRGVAGGEVLTWLARSSLFKTAILQNQLKNYVQNSAWGAAFFSIEMPVESLTERYFAILDGCTGGEVEQMYLDSAMDSSRIAAENQFKQDLKNLFVVDTIISVSDIPKYVRLIQDTYEVKIGVIGVDYLGLIQGPGHTAYETVSRIAKELKQTAKKLNLPVVMLCQASRRAGEGDIEITMDMARDSGGIEESADTILGLYKVESESSVVVGDDAPQHDLICKVLKNRKGPSGSQWRLNMNPNNFQLSHDADPYTPKRQNKGF